MKYQNYMEKLRNLEDRSDRHHHNGEYTLYDKHRM